MERTSVDADDDDDGHAMQERLRAQAEAEAEDAAIAEAIADETHAASTLQRWFRASRPLRA